MSFFQTLFKYAALFIFIYVPFLFILPSCKQTIAKVSPKLQEGVLDLYNWDFRKEKIFEIGGDYKFYPNSLLIENTESPNKEPLEGCFLILEGEQDDSECNGYKISPSGEEILGGHKKSYNVSLPHRWKGLMYDENILSAKGYGVYKFSLKLSEPQKISFTSEPDFSAISYRLWLNRNNKITLLQKSGHPTSDPNLIRSHSIPIFITDSFQEGDEIYLELANWENRVGGLLSGFYIGNSKEVNNFRDFALWSSLVIFGLNTMAGLYHFILFILRPANRYTLWFGIFCVIIGMRVLIISKPIQIYFPDLDAFSFLFKLEYITMMGSMSIFIVYIKEVLEGKVFYPWYYIVMIISGISCLIIISMDIYTVTSMLTYFQLGLVVGLLWIAFELIKHSFFKIHNNARNKYLARSIIYVCILFISAIVHDLLMYQGFFRSVELTAYGLVSFLLGQGVVIAKVNAKAWANSDHLSINLQKEVDSRTREYKEQKEIAENAFIELKESQSKLVLAERQAALTQIVTNISHELNTPLGAIQASSNNIKISIPMALAQIKNYLLSDNLNKIKTNELINLLEMISVSIEENLSTKEYRKIVKDIRIELEKYIKENSITEIDSNSIDDLAILLVDSGLNLRFKDYPLLLKKENYEILEFLNQYSGLYKKSNLIKVSAEKMFKTVTMIRSLLPDRELKVTDNIDLLKLIKESIDMYSNKFKSDINLQLDFKVSPNLVGSELEYKQIFTNILLNSIQAIETTENKNIYIRTYQISEKKVRVEFEDSGIGIPSENKEKIFQPMFTTRPHAEGSGMGLYICQKTLNKYGYKLEYSSETGKTVFWIDI
jgi:signal transduction histidine kinase